MAVKPGALAARATRGELTDTRGVCPPPAPPLAGSGREYPPARWPSWRWCGLPAGTGRRRRAPGGRPAAHCRLSGQGKKRQRQLLLRTSRRSRSRWRRRWPGARRISPALIPSFPYPDQGISRAQAPLECPAGQQRRPRRAQASLRFRHAAGRCSLQSRRLLHTHTHVGDSPTPHTGPTWRAVSVLRDKSCSASALAHAPRALWLWLLVSAAVNTPQRCSSQPSAISSSRDPMRATSCARRHARR